MKPLLWPIFWIRISLKWSFIERQRRLLHLHIQILTLITITIHTGKFERFMGSIVPLRTLTPPPPTQCISDPLLLFSTCTLMVIPTKLNFLPSKRHIRSQTLTELVSKRTLQALIVGKKIIKLLLQKLVAIVLLAVHSSCPSRCPLTILVQKTNLVTMNLLNKNDPFN